MTAAAAAKAQSSAQRVSTRAAGRDLALGAQAGHGGVEQAAAGGVGRVLAGHAQAKPRGGDEHDGAGVGLRRARAVQAHARRPARQLAEALDAYALAQERAGAAGEPGVDVFAGGVGEGVDAHDDAAVVGEGRALVELLCGCVGVALALDLQAGGRHVQLEATRGRRPAQQRSGAARLTAVAT
jgi:hypothetical protein